VMVGAQVASRILYPRFGPRRLVATGLVGIAVALVLMTQVGFDTNLWWMRVLMFAMGFSMAPVIVSTQAASFATVSSAETGYASSLFNSQRQLGSAAGVALLATVLAAVGTTHTVAGHTVANLAAYHATFLVAAGVALIGSAVALTINDADAAATMVRRHRPKPEPSPVNLEPAS
ncbi:MAG TPA: MFS transporter, partial [Acidimicrobiales bacterium]